MRDLDALADSVVLTVKAALAPILASVAGLQERVAAFDARLVTLSDLRDRVVTVETKAQPVTVDLGPVLERVAAAEARLSVLGDLRDRMVTVETKAGVPMAPDAGLSASLASVSDRLVTLEAQLTAVADLRERLTTAEKRLTDDTVTKELGLIRERVAVVETRAPVPGPAGQNGTNGKDGVDGLGWDDLSVVQEGERACAVKFIRGDRTKDAGLLMFPVEIYRGVYLEGKAYEQGDSVTWGGSEWHCNESTTTKPGDGSKAWTLKVKRGRDGKDGKDGAEGRPGRDLATQKDASWRS